MDTLRSEEAGAKLNVRNYGRVTNMVRMIPSGICWPRPSVIQDYLTIFCFFSFLGGPWFQRKLRGD